jgi:Na+-translocating ferredoxin:NAD+ oxidoreductase RnfD subunit
VGAGACADRPGARDVTTRRPDIRALAWAVFGAGLLLGAALAAIAPGLPAGACVIGAAACWVVARRLYGGLVEEKEKEGKDE